jgi:hypothetical protein
LQYQVQWGIDVDADSPEEAALEALRTQRDPQSIALVFHTIDESGDGKTVDLWGKE